MTTILFTFVRHGQTVAADGAPDSTRRLSAEGKIQADVRRRKLAGRKFDLTLISTAQRAHETASIIIGESQPACRTCVMPGLFTPQGPDHAEIQMREALDAMFSEHKYAPLAVYLQDRASYWLRRYGEESWKALLAACDEWWNSSIVRPQSVLVVGHAVLLPMLGYAAAGEVLGKELLAFQMPEAGGFEMTVEEGRVTSVSLLRD